jgi:two-component system, NtrC family, response regulator AlgB
MNKLDDGVSHGEAREPGVRALVVDDEKNIRTTLSVCLEAMGLSVTTAASAAAARECVEHARFGLAFVDLRLGNDDGLDLVPELLAVQPALATIVITAYATFDTAVEAIKRGAVDYLPKPFTPAQIRHVVERVLAQQSLTRKVAELEALVQSEVPGADLHTESSAMRSALDVIARAAPSDAPLLLRGESGTGKSVLARALHAQSCRSKGPFVTVNCPTLADELLASELFGHTRGAFTGAVSDQAGRVEAANGGTLFLDEIGEIAPPLQAKLLRFVQEKQFERLGESRVRTADVRIVAATNRDLEADVKLGRFREDLLFRLNVIEVRVPALRERREDLVRLAQDFLAFFAQRAGRPIPELTEAARQALLLYPWPGNVRELRNVLERAVILWPARSLGLEALPVHVAAMAQGKGPASAITIGGDHTLEQVEREHVLRVLARIPTLDDAARVLGIDASTLWRKRKKYGEG